MGAVLCAAAAQSVQNAALALQGEAVLRHQMGTHLIHKVAVQVINAPALHALQVQVLAAVAAFVHILEHGLFALIGHIFHNALLACQLVQIPVHRGGIGAGPLCLQMFQNVGCTDRVLAAWGIGIRTPCAARVLCIGFLGGFAPAASAAAQAVRTGQLTVEEADALLPACICSGPSFVVLTVGQSLLGSAELGVLLFASQITANYLTAALLNRFAGVRSVKPGSAAPASPAPPRLDEILADAAITYCKLCGFILFFRMLAAGAGALLPAGAGTLCSVLLEVCSGCDLASRTGRWGSLLCCAALSVQGLSVLLQVRTICPPEMTLRPLYRSRLLHLPLSLALFYLLLPGGEADVFSTLPARVLLMRRVPPDCALLVFAVCCMAACTLRSGIRQVEQKQMARNAGGCCINSKTLL